MYGYISVTVKEIDFIIEKLSDVIGNGINMALHDNAITKLWNEMPQNYETKYHKIMKWSCNIVDFYI